MYCFTLFSVVLAFGFSVFPLYKYLASLTCVLFVVSLYFGSFKIVFSLIQVVFLGCNSLVFGCFRLFSFFFWDVFVCLILFSFVFG